MKAVSNVLRSYIKLCSVDVKFKRANQSCSPSKLANQSILNGALAIEMVNNTFSESKKNFDRFDKAKNVLIKKNRDMGSEKIISSRFH